MTLDEVNELAVRLGDDARASSEQKTVANHYLERLRSAKPADVDRIGTELEALRDQIEGHDKIGAPVHDDVRWMTLTSPLSDTEARWERRAMIQFILGAAMTPVVVGLMVFLALRMPHEPFVLILLSELVAVALAYLYIILRVHQQASTAQERMAEKRVGLTFLRIVLQEYGEHPQIKALLELGAQMFLGHHAPTTILLGPEDAKAITQILGSRAGAPAEKEKGT